MNLGFFDRVYQVTERIPKGKVATYGQIARAIGAPRCARQVGFALHVNPRPGDIPCHRVVNRYGQLSGAFAFGGIDVQQALLEQEGVEVVDGTVDLKTYQWRD